MDNKNDIYENEINVEDFVDPSRGERNGKGKRPKKLVIGATAVAAALAVGVSAMGISFASPDAPEAELVSLTLSQESDPSGIILMDVSDIVKEALPSVVSITSRSLINYYDNSFGDFGGRGGLGDIWNYIFGDSFGGNGDIYFYQEPADDLPAIEGEEGIDSEMPKEIDRSMGSGTIIAMTDDELMILTSYHVVEGNSSLYVTFIDENSVDGTIRSADADKDIAIVSVPLADIPQETLDVIKVATIATQEPEVGDGCIVIGNALGYGISVTTGIVSALDRDIYADGKSLNVIQTDAAINNGNSGGCMLNSRGEIIGINEAKVKRSFVEGMCYAIPVQKNLELIETLINSEGVTSESTEYTSGSGAFLGIRGRDVTEEISADYGIPKGVYVSETVQGSGAKDAGLLSGDIIVAIDGEEVLTMTELQSILLEHNAGDEVVLQVMRNTEGEYVSMDVNVVLTDWIS